MGIYLCLQLHIKSLIRLWFSDESHIGPSSKTKIYIYACSCARGVIVTIGIVLVFQKPEFKITGGKDIPGFRTAGKPHLLLFLWRLCRLLITPFDELLPGNGRRVKHLSMACSVSGRSCPVVLMVTSGSAMSDTSRYTSNRSIGCRSEQLKTVM